MTAPANEAGRAGMAGRGMNKRAAKSLAESGTITVGQLRALIDGARARGGMSRVNPAIPLDRALDIYTGALAGRDAAEAPKGLVPDPYRHNRSKPSRDSLIVTNILRDCGA